ncbi:MAG TPA: tetratricopeptide repeat protein, partial [Chthoniobacterales bacterium]
VARAERARAERRFNDVRRLANSFMFELHDEIDQGPVKAKELLVRRASEYLNSLAEEAAGDRDLQRELAIAYIKIGDVQGRFLLQNLGDTKGAFESYSKALQLSEQLAAGKPGDRELQEWLALSRLRVGEINMSLGNSTEAARQFRHGLAIVESLLNANPSDAALRVNAANAHRLVGMALGLPGVTNLGDTQGALEHLRRAAALFESLSPEELAKSRPIFSLNTADNRMEFAAVYAELAELLRASGAPGEAIEFQRKALVLCDAVLVDHPKNVQVRRNTAAHTWNVAAQLVTTGGNLDEALGLIRKSLAIYEQLAAEDPNDVNARKDLAQSHRNMARVLSARKEPAGAIEHNSKAVALFREIVARDATNAFMRRQLALTEMRQSMFLSDDARPQEAMPHAREAVSIGEDLIAADAKNATARDTLARSYSQLGRCHVQLASLTTAADQKRAGLREAISCYQRSREAWLALRDSGALPAVDAGKIGDVAREIARCEEELRGL